VPTLRCDYHPPSLIGFTRAGSYSSNATAFDERLSTT